MLSPSEKQMLRQTIVELQTAIGLLSLALSYDEDDADNAIGKTFGCVGNAERRLSDARQQINARRDEARTRARGGV